EARRHASRLALIQGQNQCEAGNVGRGLLWLARAMELASDEDAADLRQAAQTSWTMWKPTLAPLSGYLDAGRTVAVPGEPGSGKRIVTGGGDGRVRAWDAAPSGGQLWQAQVSEGSDVRALAFSPDGVRLAAAAGPRVVQLKAENGTPIGQGLDLPENVT